jgi:Icc-related predicted phosphoesterase
VRILAVADIESKALWDYFDAKKLSDVDLIISCGDLNARYLEFLVTMAHCPVIYVHGNHDDRYMNDPPEGCICIEDRIYRYRGLRILGLGGSMRYKDGQNMYTEKAMRRRVLKARIKAFFLGGVDIVVTHAPVRGWGDLEDLPHRGFKCFDKFVRAVRPRILVHGHVHMTYGHFVREREHESGTRLLNAYEYCYFDI